jgi:hypothetical protein
MAGTDDVKPSSLETVGASVLDMMGIPRSLSNAKELALAVLDRLYANERALKEIRDILQKNVR